MFEISLGQTPRRPPSSQGIVEQESHHIGLSKKLGHGGQFSGTDLHFGGVDLILFLGLPELVHPAEAIISSEGF